MSDATAVIDAYLGALAESDGARRTEMIQQAWTPDARFVDPLYEVEGHAALAELALGVQEQYPAHQFRRTSGVDVHHDVVRFTWELAAPDDSQVVAGTDVGILAPDGRLQAVASFFGDVPPADEAA
jgi:hypothetical protein